MVVVGGAVPPYVLVPALVFFGKAQHGIMGKGEQKTGYSNLTLEVSTVSSCVQTLGQRRGYIFWNGKAAELKSTPCFPFLIRTSRRGPPRCHCFNSPIYACRI